MASRLTHCSVIHLACAYIRAVCPFKTGPFKYITPLIEKREGIDFFAEAAAIVWCTVMVVVVVHRPLACCGGNDLFVLFSS